MNARKKLVFLSFVAVCSLVLNMVFPVGVLADDITPPPDTGTTQTAPTEPPPTEDVAPTEPAPTEPAPTDAPPVLVTVAPSEPPALATVEPSGAAPTDPPVLATVPLELTAEPSEPAAPADLSEVVAAAADAGVVLADNSGEALQLGTVDAAEALSTGDPTGTLSATAIAGHAGLAAGATFSYYQSSDSHPNGTCAVSANTLTCYWDHPLAQAVSDAAADSIVTVEAGSVFHDNVIVDVAGLTILGLPGDPTLAGAAWNAPILEGDNTANSGDIGVTIHAEGVSLLGFIIQGYDTAVYQNVVSGNNTVDINNNTIRNNGEGIRIEKGGGSPNTQIHYNIFQGNAGLDLVNNNDSNNQFVDAQNNYWGCATGPVVLHHWRQNPSPDNKWVYGDYYVDWTTKTDITSIYPNLGSVDYSGCGVLFGYDGSTAQPNQSYWDLQINTKGYSPFKINLNGAPGTEPPPTSTPTNTPVPPTATNTPTVVPPTATNTPTVVPPTATNTPTVVPPTATNTPTVVPPTATNTPTDIPPTATNTPTDIPPTATPVPPTPIPPPYVPQRGGGFIPVTGGELHAVAAGLAHSCAITPEGNVLCWGANDYGQLGDGTNTDANLPVEVVGVTGATTIVAGANHTCILSGDAVWCWGQNDKGQVGDGTTTSRNKPVQVLTGALDVTAGADYTCATLLSGRVMCWGNNANGQLGDGSKRNHLVPFLASLITGVGNVDAGVDQTCGITMAGMIKCWGGGGAARNVGTLTPVDQGDLLPRMDLAVDRFGSLIMGLYNEGLPVVIQSGQFKQVGALTDVVEIDSGTNHICARLGKGTVHCWGANGFGQLGNNSTTDNPAPGMVLNLTGASDLAVGASHACAIVDRPGGGIGVQCWGLNADGQLGDGTNSNSLIPVDVGGE